MVHLRKLALYCILFFLLPNCKKDITKQTIVPYTVIIYLAGDANGLREDISEKLDSIKKGWKSDFQGNLLVYLDSAKNSNPQLLQATTNNNNQSYWKAIKNYNNKNSADPNLLKTVLNDVLILFPANSYGLIVFSHGSGWLPRNTINNRFGFATTIKKNIRTYGIIADGSMEMSQNDFAKALPNHIFDFILFENCFMGGVETVAELKDKTNYIGGSVTEILSPGFTKIYPQLLNSLFKNTPDLTDFAEIYFNYWNTQTGDYKSATYSIVKTSEIINLTNWIKKNAKIDSLIDTKTLQYFDRSSKNNLFFDLQDYLIKISPIGSHQELQSILDKLIIYKKCTPTFLPNYGGFKITKFCGISTYVMQYNLSDLNSLYRYTNWYNIIH